jgi:crotonobetainyl-CoA:carnitine CoA-transferase CaiB-like acyl-CoA transferase
VYRTADGYVAVTVKTDDAFARVASLVPPLVPFASLSTEERIDRRVVLDTAFLSWAESRTADELVGRLRPIEGVAAGRCHSFASALDSGDLVRHGQIETLDHPVTGTRSYVRLPVRIDGKPMSSTRPAPVFAQHTDEVLREWISADRDAIAKLRDENAIGTVPAARR